MNDARTADLARWNISLHIFVVLSDFGDPLSKQ